MKHGLEIAAVDGETAEHHAQKHDQPDYREHAQNPHMEFGFPK
jgi:hypothetical protein